MDIDADVVALAAVAAAGLAAVLLVVVVVLGLQLRGVRRWARAQSTGTDGVRPVGSARSAAGLVHAELTSVREDLDGLRAAQQAAVSRVGLVRYDAFAQMGGMQSYSAALLDAHGSGLVLSTINGRQESRSYAKPVVDGRSEHALTDEEQDAVRAALEQPATRRAVVARRRRSRRA